MDDDGDGMLVCIATSVHTIYSIVVCVCTVYKWKMKHLFFVFTTHKVITMKKILYVLGQRISGEKHGSHAS